MTRQERKKHRGEEEEEEGGEEEEGALVHSIDAVCVAFSIPNEQYSNVGPNQQRWYAKWKLSLKCVHIAYNVFVRFGTDLHAQSVLIDKVSASELRRKFIKVALSVGALRSATVRLGYTVQSGRVRRWPKTFTNVFLTQQTQKYLPPTIRDFLYYN